MSSSPLGDLPLVGGPDLPIGVFCPPHPYETTPERYQELAAAGMTFLITGNYLFDQHINRRALESAETAARLTFGGPAEQFRPDTADYAAVESPADLRLAAGAAVLYRLGWRG